MNIRIPCGRLTCLCLALSATLHGAAAPQPPAIEQIVVEQVDAQIAAGWGEHAALRGGGSGHDLVRTAVVSGSYTDLPEQTASNGPEFGYSVALDGDWLAVGAPGTMSDAGSGLGGIKETGTVFIFRHVDGGWQMQQRVGLAQFGTAPRCGSAVAMRGPNLLIGCPGAGVFMTPDSGHGTYMVYRRNGDDDWDFVSIDAVSTSGAQCGSAVSLSDVGFNGITIAAIGCPGWSNHQGRVNLHSYDGLAGTWSAPSFVTGSGGGANNRFGESVSVYRPFIGGLSQRLAVGAPNKLFDLNPGAGWVHVFEGGSWTEVAHFSGFQTSQYFGSAVAITADQLLVGARGAFSSACNGSSQCGAISRYQRISDLWTFQDGGIAINSGGSPPGGQPDMEFGAAVAIGFDNWIAAAAPRADSTQSTIPPGTAADVGMVELRRNDDGGFNAGGSAWQGELRPGSLTSLQFSGGRFGTSLDFGGRRLAIGYPRSGGLLTGRRGQVWIYEEDRIFADGFES